MHTVPWLIAVPGILCLLAYHLIPTAAGSWYAFTDWDGLTDARFVGLDNFRELFQDPVTRGALWHTLYLAGSFFVLVNVIGLALAIGLNRTLKSRNVLRAVFFAPVVMSPLAVSFIWQYIFDPRGGLNQLLATVGLETWQRTWLGDPQLALWMILIVLVWQFSGLTMVIYLAGLQSISVDLIEASAVDGATTWTRFRRIVLPLLAPAITVNATLTLIFGLRVFDHVIALTGGGPLNATETLATQVWKQTFVEGRYGYGSASALILTALIAALALAQLAVLRARESRI
jgi:raffinose/stachyose/melibiose transport system permease protein